MLATLLLFAQEHVVEEAEPSKTPFYVAASALVAYALILSAVGIRKHDTFPPSKAVGRAAHTGLRSTGRGGDVHRGHHGVAT